MEKPSGSVDYGQVAAAYRIQGIAGAMAGRIYSVSGRELTFGRDPACQVAFPQEAEESRGVSHRHCRIYLQGGVLQLEDSDSTYGTYLKDKGKLVPGQPFCLREGDVFWLGSEENSFIVNR